MVSRHTAWQKSFDFLGTKPIIVEPSAGQLTCDAGLIPIRQFDEHIGLTEQFAHALCDPRHEPRGISHGQHPADGTDEENDRAESCSTRSSAVTLTDRRSDHPAGGARSSAEPCPPVGKKKRTGKGPYRPPAKHPWRRQFQLNQPDISIVL